MNRPEHGLEGPHKRYTGRHRIKGARTEAFLHGAGRATIGTFAVASALAYDIAVRPENGDRMLPLMLATTVAGGLTASGARRMNLAPNTARMAAVTASVAIGSIVGELMAFRYGTASPNAGDQLGYWALGTTMGAATGAAMGVVHVPPESTGKPDKKDTTFTDENVPLWGADVTTMALPPVKAPQASAARHRAATTNDPTVTWHMPSPSRPPQPSLVRPPALPITYADIASSRAVERPVAQQPDNIVLQQPPEWPPRQPGA